VFGVWVELRGARSKLRRKLCARKWPTNLRIQLFFAVGWGVERVKSPNLFFLRREFAAAFL